MGQIITDLRIMRDITFKEMSSKSYNTGIIDFRWYYFKSCK